MTITLIIIGILFAIIGLVGCVLPVIPGPILSLLALIILSFAKDWEPFSATFLIIMTGLSLFVSVLDYFIPVVGAKKSGATRPGLWFSAIGMIIGIFFFPPWGIFIGALIGGFAGEILAGSERRKALKVSWGIFVSNIVGIGLKSAFSLFVLFFYLKEMF